MWPGRSEEHTSELQSHSDISYAVFCLKKKKTGHDLALETGVVVDIARPLRQTRLAVCPKRQEAPRAPQWGPRGGQVAQLARRGHATLACASPCLGVID